MAAKDLILIEYPFSTGIHVGKTKGGADVWFGAEIPRWIIDGAGMQCIIGTGYTDRTFQLVLEPPAVAPEMYDSTWRSGFDCVVSYGPPWTSNTKRLERCPWPFGWEYPKPPGPNDNPLPGWHKRKHCVAAVMGNKTSSHYLGRYWYRESVADFLFAAYPAGFVARGRPMFNKPWCLGDIPGHARQKREWLSGYRFALCLENCSMPGYVTEKLVDALAAGCIPIYHSSEEWIEEEGFIPRNASSPREALRIFEEFKDDRAYRDFFDGVKLNKLIERLSPQPLFDLLEELFL